VNLIVLKVDGTRDVWMNATVEASLNESIVVSISVSADNDGEYPIWARTYAKGQWVEIHNADLEARDIASGPTGATGQTAQTYEHWRKKFERDGR
jgi:hypothetical protein